MTDCTEELTESLAKSAVTYDWIEPSGSELYNIWSNLEFLGVTDSHPLYDAVVKRALELYPEELKQYED